MNRKLLRSSDCAALILPIFYAKALTNQCRLQNMGNESSGNRQVKTPNRQVVRGKSIHTPSRRSSNSTTRSGDNALAAAYGSSDNRPIISAIHPIQTANLPITFRFSWQFVQTLWRPAVVTTEVTMEVATEVRRMMENIRGEMARKELQIALGLKNDEHFRKAYLVPALEAGFIEMTIPDKPNSRLQKYRFTAKGRAWLTGRKQ
jgi:hypothetical protein